MKTFNILVSATVSTLLMTAYSYYKSIKHQDQFIEPQLLAALMENATDNKKVKEEIGAPEGWATHLAIGVSYNVIYNWIWRKTSIKPNILSGLVIGAISGVAGVGAWKTIFYLHPNPPKTDYKRFYRQLLGAHVVFGTSSALCYATIEKLKQD